MDNQSIKFIVAVVLFFVVMVAYVLIRNRWTYCNKDKYRDTKFKNNDFILWSFWAWDIKKFIEKGE